MNTRNLIILIIVLVLTGCGQSKKKETVFIEKPQAKQEDVKNFDNHPGKLVYDQVCLACHQADAMGTPGMHPPLVNTEWIMGENNQLINLMLNGLSGQITVNGEVYKNFMPPNRNLTNQQIADVLTYVRLNFNNLDKPVTAEEVQKLRK